MGFEALLDIITVLFELAPILLAISILILILKMIDSAISGFIIILTSVFMTILLVNPMTATAEPISNNYLDKKGFDYLNICNTYICINDTDYVAQSNFVLRDYEWADSHEWEYLNSSVNETKPTKVIQWEPNTKNHLILFSKMVYNYTINDILRFRIRYIPYDTKDTMSLRIRFSEYADNNYVNNVSGSYSYIIGGYAEYQSVYDYPQTTMQRFSNINHYWANHTFGGDIYHNPYKFYEKRYGGNNSLSNFNVTKINYEIAKTINTYEALTITINPENFYDRDLNAVLSSYQFMNIGIVKENPLDTVIIDMLEVKQKKVSETFKDKPFLELYEFRNLDNPRNSRILMAMNLVRNNYSSLNVDTFILGIDYSDIPLPYLYYNISGADYTINVSFSNYFTSVGDETLFIGYQFSTLFDAINNSYAFKITAKYSPNLRNAGGTVFYYYETKTVLCYVDNGYSEILSVEHYENYENTDLKLSYVSGSSKFDQKDNAFSKIDIDLKGDTVLVKDIDNAGFRFPSLNDLSKMILDALKPIFSVLEVLQDSLMGPLNSILSTISDISDNIGSLSGVLDTVSGYIDDISGYVDELEGVLDTVSETMDNVYGVINSISGFVSSVLTTLLNFYNSILEVKNYFGGWYNLLTALVNTLIDMLDDMSTTFINFVTNAVSTLTLFWDLTFSIIGVTFSYFLIFRMVRFGETGDLNDLWGIFEVLYMVALFFKSLFELLWSVIP